MPPSSRPKSTQKSALVEHARTRSKACHAWSKASKQRGDTAPNLGEDAPYYADTADILAGTARLEVRHAPHSVETSVLADKPQFRSKPHRIRPRRIDILSASPGLGRNSTRQGRQLGQDCSLVGLTAPDQETRTQPRSPAGPTLWLRSRTVAFEGPCRHVSSGMGGMHAAGATTRTGEVSPHLGRAGPG